MYQIKSSREDEFQLITFYTEFGIININKLSINALYYMAILYILSITNG